MKVWGTQVFSGRNTGICDVYTERGVVQEAAQRSPGQGGSFSFSELGFLVSQTGTLAFFSHSRGRRGSSALRAPWPSAEVVELFEFLLRSSLFFAACRLRSSEARPSQPRFCRPCARSWLSFPGRCRLAFWVEGFLWTR